MTVLDTAGLFVLLNNKDLGEVNGDRLSIGAALVLRKKHRSGFL
jgi:hypothetical protein